MPGLPRVPRPPPEPPRAGRPFFSRWMQFAQIFCSRSGSPRSLILLQCEVDGAPYCAHGNAPPAPAAGVLVPISSVTEEPPLTGAFAALFALSSASHECSAVTQLGGIFSQTSMSVKPVGSNLPIVLPYSAVILGGARE